MESVETRSGGFRHKVRPNNGWVRKMFELLLPFMLSNASCRIRGIGIDATTTSGSGVGIGVGGGVKGCEQ